MAYRALVICNWEYADPETVYSELKGPRTDLSLMTGVLGNPPYGIFDVEQRENLGWAGLRNEFAAFLKKATPADRLLIYFSGHGDRLLDGRLALCGVDTNSELLEATSFDTNELREWIEGANRAPSTMVILDCCYAGAMKGVLSEKDIADSLGAGTLVLSSGGSQPTKDAQKDDEGSPFTVALSEILLDPELPGDENGFLTVDVVYDRLVSRDPPLQPLPKRNVMSQGTFALAQRERTVEQSRPTLPGLQEFSLETINVTFHGTSVTADSAADAAETLVLTSFDDNRRAAVRRMTQLSDAIVRVAAYDEDEWAQRAVRRAWNCLGSMLFDCALPAGVQDRIRSRSDALGGPVLKLRLAFADEPQTRRLESFPWEYLYRDQDPGSDPDVQEPEPLALAPGLLVERVIRSESATVDLRLGGDGAPIGAEREIVPTVGVISSLRGSFAEAAAQIADGLTSMAGLNVVFDLRASDARWSTFLDVAEQGPKLLVMFAPVCRRPQGVEIGFWSDLPAKEGQVQAEWHAEDELIQHFKMSASTFDAILFVTFAANPGQDSFRATSELGRNLARAGLGPVVFVCHWPGYVNHVPALARDTFPVLLIDVLTRGKPFDHAVYYAKNRVIGRGSKESRRLFGVPGYFVTEPVVGEHGTQISPTSAAASRRTQPRSASADAPKRSA